MIVTWIALAIWLALLVFAFWDDICERLQTWHVRVDYVMPPLYVPDPERPRWLVVTRPLFGKKETTAQAFAIDGPDFTYWTWRKTNQGNIEDMPRRIKGKCTEAKNAFEKACAAYDKARPPV